MSDILAKLAAPFAPGQVDWRVGATNKEKTKGMALAYIDSRAVMHRLDEVCGHLWQCDYVPMPNGTVCCKIGIKVGEEWIWRANGAINYPDNDKPDAKEMAAKGSYSDAFKRAAVLWGIGQYLYDLDSPWVEIVPKGNSYVFADGVLAQLNRRLGGAPAAQVSAEPPPSTMQGRRNEADGVKKARERANNAHAALGKMVTMVELNSWLGKWGSTVEKLRDVAPDEFTALDDKINITADRLNTLVAG